MALPRTEPSDESQSGEGRPIREAGNAPAPTQHLHDPLPQLAPRRAGRVANLRLRAPQESSAMKNITRLIPRRPVRPAA